MKLRIQRQVLKLDDDGFGECRIPEPDENSVNHHVRFEPLNDRAVAVFFTDVVWEESDDAAFLMRELEGDDGEVEDLEDV